MGLAKRNIVENNIENIKAWEKQRVPLMEVARRLKLKYDTLVKYLKVFNISYTKNPSRKGMHHPEQQASLEQVLTSMCSNGRKRKKLIEAGVKSAVCECCGLSEWMGLPIPLELHHKDFNHYNNNIENLQILCANCHMQAHNYCNNFAE